MRSPRTSSSGACGRYRWTVPATATRIWTCNCPPPSARVTIASSCPGFYDGDGVYKVRFSPPAQGEWRYETRSNRPELNGKSGSFTAGPPSADNHGPMQVFKTFYLRYADGTPYHQFGTTCYAWMHQTEELQQQTLKTLAASPFNKIRFCVFPKSYAYNRTSRSCSPSRRRPTARSTSTGPIRLSGITSSSGSWTCSGWASRPT